MNALERIHEQARELRRHIVLPEGDEPRTLQAAVLVTRRGLARVTLLGRREDVLARARETGADLGGVEIGPPPERRRETDLALRVYLERVARRGITADEARQHLEDPLLWAALRCLRGALRRVRGGRALDHDGRHPARGAPRRSACAAGVARISSFMLMVTPRPELARRRPAGVRGLRREPRPHRACELAEIALLTAENATALPGRRAAGGAALVLHPGQRRPPAVAQGRRGRAHRAGSRPRAARRRRAAGGRRAGAGGGGEQGAGEPGGRAGPTCWSSPTSTPATSATSWWSGSRARGRSGPSCRGSRGRRTTSRAAARSRTSWTSSP